MKNIRCKLGLHKPLEGYCMVIIRQHKNGKKYRRNYRICKRCGKKLGALAIRPIESAYKMVFHKYVP